MNYKKYLRTFGVALALSASLVFTACGTSTESTSSNVTVTEESVSEVEATTDNSSDDLFTNRDLTQDYDDSEAVHITLADGSSTADDESGLTIDQSTNTITITDEGIYVFTGTLSDGQIKVEAEDTDKVQIVLNNVTLGNDTSACIYAYEADKVFVTTAEGTTNTLTTTGTFEADGDTNVDGVIFAKCTLTVNGLGTLNIESSDNGIVSKDNLKLTGSTLNITCTGHGLEGKDSVRIGGGTLNVLESYEGIEGAVIYIVDGELNIVASDDGINASSDNTSSDSMMGDETCAIYIQGGSTYINAGGDGIDSNGYLYVSGGTTYVDGPTNGANGALDTGLEATVTGGVIIASGASGMAENFGQNSTQGAIMVNTSGNETGTITLTDSEGNVLASYTPSKTYGNVVISCPGIVDGGTYTITTGSSSQEVTMDGLIYGSGMGMMGGGQMGGGGRMNGGGKMENSGEMGERPDMNEDFNPEDFDGEMPEMPEDFNPEEFDGEMPDMENMPQGGRPQGGRGQAPEN